MKRYFFLILLYHLSLMAMEVDPCHAESVCIVRHEISIKTTVIKWEPKPTNYDSLKVYTYYGNNKCYEHFFKPKSSSRLKLYISSSQPFGIVNPRYTDIWRNPYTTHHYTAGFNADRTRLSVITIHGLIGALTQENQVIKQFSWHPKRTLIAATLGVNKLVFFDYKNNFTYDFFAMNNQQILAMEFNPDGKYLAVATDRYLYIFDVAKWVPIIPARDEL